MTENTAETTEQVPERRWGYEVFALKDIVAQDEKMKGKMVYSSRDTGEVTILERDDPDTRDAVEDNWTYDVPFVDWLAEARVKRELNTPDSLQGLLVVDYTTAKVYEIPSGTNEFDPEGPTVYHPASDHPELHQNLKSDLHKYGGRPNPRRMHSEQGFLGYRRGRAERWLRSYLPKKMKSIRESLPQRA